MIIGLGVAVIAFTAVTAARASRTLNDCAPKAFGESAFGALRSV
jgi:hypothetical protein